MPNTAFHEAACKFIDLVMQQVGAIERALFADARDDELRRRRKELQAASEAKGVGYRLPTGETVRLVGEFNPWDRDDGEFAEALQAVNTQICGTNSPEIALVKAVADSHRAYLLGARESFYESRLEVAFSIRWEHFNNIDELKEAVGYIASAEADANDPPKTLAVVAEGSTPPLTAIPSYFIRNAEPQSLTLLEHLLKVGPTTRQELSGSFFPKPIQIGSVGKALNRLDEDLRAYADDAYRLVLGSRGAVRVDQLNQNETETD